MPHSKKRKRNSAPAPSKKKVTTTVRDDVAADAERSRKAKFFPKAKTKSELSVEDVVEKHNKIKEKVFSRFSFKADTKHQYLPGEFVNEGNKKRRRIFNPTASIDIPANLNLFARAAYSQKAPPGTKLVYKQDDISVFERGGTYVIAHRGTATKQDIATDIELARGKVGKEFGERTNTTKALIEFIREKSPDAKIYMTGHSLGGTTVNVSMRDEFISSNVEQAAVYNMGSSPFFDNKLADKVDSIVMFGDPVSLFAEKTEVRKNFRSARIAVGIPTIGLGGMIPSLVKVHSINEF